MVAAHRAGGAIPAPSGGLAPIPVRSNPRPEVVVVEDEEGTWWGATRQGLSLPTERRRGRAWGKWGPEGDPPRQHNFQFCTISGNLCTNRQGSRRGSPKWIGYPFRVPFSQRNSPFFARSRLWRAQKTPHPPGAAAPPLSVE